MNITNIVNAANRNANYASVGRKALALLVYLAVAPAIIFSQISFTEYFNVSIEALIEVSPYFIAAITITIFGTLVQKFTSLNRKSVAFITMALVALCLITAIGVGTAVIIAAFGWILLLYGLIAGLIATIAAMLVLSLP